MENEQDDEYKIECEGGSIAADIGRFLYALYNKWSGIIMCSALAIGLTLFYGFGGVIRPAWYAVIVGGALLASTFPVWREEYRRASELEFDLRREKQFHEVFVKGLKEERAREEMQRNQDAVWRPRGSLNSYIEGSALKNELVLKDSQVFQVDAIDFLSPDGAKLAEVEIDKNDLRKEYRIPITHEVILKANHLHLDKGSVRYRVSRGNAVYEGLLPFIVKTEMLPQNTSLGSGLVLWLRLIG